MPGITTFGVGDITPLKKNQMDKKMSNDMEGNTYNSAIIIVGDLVGF